MYELTRSAADFTAHAKSAKSLLGGEKTGSTTPALTRLRFTQPQEFVLLPPPLLVSSLIIYLSDVWLSLLHSDALITTS